MLFRFRRPAFALVLFGLTLSGCTTGAPGDILGSLSPGVTPQPRTGSGTLPPPPGLSADPADAPLTPGRIVAPASASAVREAAVDERVPEAPSTRVQPLGDLPRGAVGVMILPPAPRLDVIDIEAVRQGLAGQPPRPVASPAPAAPAPASAQTSAQGGLL